MTDWITQKKCYQASYPVDFQPKAHFVYRAWANMSERDTLPCIQASSSINHDIASDDVIVIGDQDARNFVLAGALTANRSQSLFHAVRRGARFTEIRVEQPHIKQGETPEEILILKGNDWRKLLFEYADLAARKNNVKPINAEKNMTGYCTWYYYYKNVTGQDLLDNVKALSENRSEYAAEYVQIDDGYQSLQGDWLTRDDKWPFTLETAAKTIIDAGMKPGIWLMPFVASTASQTYKQHPDWFVKDATGNAVIQEGWSPEPDNLWCCLDGSNPEVRKHIADVFQAFWNMGYVYFKLDGLAFGLADGQRLDKDATAVSAFHQLMQAIREAVPKAIILACSEPFMLCLGHCDNARGSGDTSRYYAYEYFPNTNSVFPTVGIKNALHVTMSNFWKFDRWFRIDPDSLMARQDNAFYTLGEARMSVLTGIVTGVVLTSDKLDTIAPDRLHLLGLAQKYRMRNVMPFIDSYPNFYPHLFEGTIDGKRAVAVINASETPMICSFEKLSLPENCHEIFRDASFHKQAELPAHDAAIFMGI